MCISICEQIILGEAEGSEILIPVHRITMNVITVKTGYNIVLYWRFRYPSGFGIGDIIFQNGEKLLLKVLNERYKLLHYIKFGIH